MKKILRIMKDIEINDKTLQYRVAGDFVWTDFYDGTKEVIRYKFNWKNFKFNSYKKTIPNRIFRIDEDANSTKVTKNWWRNKIQTNIELLNREKELERG